LENLNDGENINRVWENVKEYIKTSPEESLDPHELKRPKPWFYEEEFLRFLDQRKLAKMQWAQDPGQNNVDNLNNIRREASKHFRDKMKTSES
jgi:hypothetical protein